LKERPLPRPLGALEQRLAAWPEERLAARWKVALKVPRRDELEGRTRGFRSQHKILVHPPTACHNSCRNLPSLPPGIISSLICFFGPTHRARNARAAASEECASAAEIMD